MLGRVDLVSVMGGLELRYGRGAEKGWSAWEGRPLRGWGTWEGEMWEGSTRHGCRKYECRRARVRVTPRPSPTPHPNPKGVSDLA